MLTDHPIFDNIDSDVIPAEDELKKGPDYKRVLKAFQNCRTVYDMETLLVDMKLDKAYPKAQAFFENIKQHVRPLYMPSCIEDLFEDLSTKLQIAHLTSPWNKKPTTYTRMAYNCHLTSSDGLSNDGLDITVLNGTHYFHTTFDDYNIDQVYDIYDLITTIEAICNKEPLNKKELPEDLCDYYNALAMHTEDGEVLYGIEIKQFQKEIERTLTHENA